MIDSSRSSDLPLAKSPDRSHRGALSIEELEQLTAFALLLETEGFEAVPELLQMDPADCRDLFTETMEGLEAGARVLRDSLAG